MQLIFSGAAQTVTGSKHILKTAKGTTLLLDCGFFQGKGADNDKLNRTFSFEPKSIDAVILSHAHIDHSGNLPGLIKQGFTGKIYATPATYDLCKVMLTDSAHIQEGDINYINKHRQLQGRPLLKPLYTLHDVEKCLSHFQLVPYNNWYTINQEVKFMYTDAGHILGSASVNLIITEGANEIKICFTGDVGRSTDLLLKSPAPFPQADYILCESTYGNSVHEPINDAKNRLLKIVTETCLVKKGKLLIPAFSLGRTQEIVYTLDRLNAEGLLPPVKIFVDSPLATNATEIMRAHPESFNADVIQFMHTHSDPFGFGNLTYTKTVEESMALNSLKEPCIIIAASGMMDAGRIKHHIQNAIDNPKNTLLIVGYCPPDTLGGDLLAKKSHVKLFGKTVPVKFQIEVIHSYSAHADSQELIQFLGCQDKSLIKKLFIVHGEPNVQHDFKEHLLQLGYRNIEIPKTGDTYTLT